MDQGSTGQPIGQPPAAVGGATRAGSSDSLRVLSLGGAMCRPLDNPGARPRRRALIVVALLATIAGCSGSGGTVITPSPTGQPPRSIAPADLPSLFPTATEVGEALGLEVEAMGVQADMSQAWEHIDITPGALVAKHVQAYRWPPGGTGGAPDDAGAGFVIDIDLFRNPVDGAAYGERVGAIVEGTAFSTGLSADRVTTGSWTSDQGFGGSSIAVQAGSIVVLVTAFRTGATELEAAAEEIAALILARIDG